MTKKKKRFLPLRPNVLHVLIALAEGERHGYAIKQFVESSTEGVVRMGPGTLYETLQRLESDGLIREVSGSSLGESPHAQRRYYELTRLGRSILDAELERLATVVDRARAAKRQAT